ncbi:hypothetical protein ZWY2020_027814 [Hordeum vulgare]|nr:hypothetical protein ZWY2020_027814 [Hordeum vulgare]
MYAVVRACVRARCRSHCRPGSVGALHGSAARAAAAAAGGRDVVVVGGGPAPCGVRVPAAAVRAGCVFAPHFSGSGRERRGAVRGGAPCSAPATWLLLSRVPVALRRDTARTVCYEAQARVADPVYGCVGTILALQHQVIACTDPRLRKRTVLTATALFLLIGVDGRCPPGPALRPANPASSTAGWPREHAPGHRGATGSAAAGVIRRRRRARW